MKSLGTRASYKKGCSAVVYCTASSPYLGAFRFDALDKVSPWKTKHVVSGSDIPSVSGTLVENGSTVAVAPSNRHVLFGGDGMTTIAIYSFDTVDGFVSLSQKTDGNIIPDEFKNVRGIGFTQDESSVVVSSDLHLASYEWDSSGIGSQVIGSNNWYVQNELISITATPIQRRGGPLSFIQHNQLQLGGDETIVQIQFNETSGGLVSGKHWSYDLDGNWLGGSDLSSGGSNSSVPYPANVSPVESFRSGITANSLVWVQTPSPSGGELKSTTVSNANWQDVVQDRTSSLPVYDAGNNTARYAMFDPYGRLIIACNPSSTIYQLQIYTQDASNASYTLLDSQEFAGGLINSFSYDVDQDILFVSSQSAPYITAYRMGAKGFSFKYPDPVSDAGSAVHKMSIVYDEDWKSFNS